MLSVQKSNYTTKGTTHPHPNTSPGHFPTDTKIHQPIVDSDLLWPVTHPFPLHSMGRKFHTYTSCFSLWNTKELLVWPGSWHFHSWFLTESKVQFPGPAFGVWDQPLELGIFAMPHPDTSTKAHIQPWTGVYGKSRPKPKGSAMDRFVKQETLILTPLPQTKPIV